MIETPGAVKVQADAAQADVGLVAMNSAMNRMIIDRTTADATVPEGRRTVVALLSASVISLLVWGLIVVLNVH
ncbi:MAG TPA: hypothetical protein VH560_01995 [Polyangia bacterium]|jgi:hypothetical protein|nr:hypothetical protein [Polyangia bacterium]